uniref:DUF6729 domain-containing protein n=1 Tax=Branchiostoma floridae TaxID=7739 RepID=C3YT34_BRAFL|eukprot:XP_002600389.1 hypothetical protein BRAFLDRAFT_99580 [Branchiostoma floridae]
MAQRKQLPTVQVTTSTSDKTTVTADKTVQNSTQGSQLISRSTLDTTTPSETNRQSKSSTEGSRFPTVQVTTSTSSSDKTTVTADKTEQNSTQGSQLTSRSTLHTTTPSETNRQSKSSTEGSRFPTVQVTTSTSDKTTVTADKTEQNSTQGSQLTSRSTLDTTTPSETNRQSKSSTEGSRLPTMQTQWETFLPKKLRNNISPADQAWIAQCLYDHNGKLRENLPNQNWYHPPSPQVPMGVPPDPNQYFRQRMFLWAPMRMWKIPLNCPKCKLQLSHSGIYTRAREVVDIDSRYYLVSLDYPRCNKCKVPYCPWSTDILNQLDAYHRSTFPAVLTKYAALDKRCVTLMKPRTQGNSSSLTQQALEEIHSEAWGKKCMHYLSDCELHKKGTQLTGLTCLYQAPPAYRPLPLAQWFEAVHTNEILGHEDEMKAIITSTYGRVLKMDSTKKVTKKLAGDVASSASWMTNISNEAGEVLNSVLTTGEGAGLQEVCQGIVKRYTNAHEPPPEVIYVDTHCCNDKDELIAIQYLLAQSGRGDLNPSVVRDDDVGNLLPELNLEEANEEDNVDATVCLAEHIRSENSEVVKSSDCLGHLPQVVMFSNRLGHLPQVVMFSNRLGHLPQVVMFLNRLSHLPQVKMTKLYMTHGQAAQCPSTNRVSECLCLRLMRKFDLPRNRPNDATGKRLPHVQSIVHTYGIVQQLLADSRVVQEKTNIVLVVINNTTVSAWMSDRQKRVDREALLKGTSLPASITTAEEPLAEAHQLPTEESAHGHEHMQFDEPENRQGQSAKRPRNSAPRGSAVPIPYLQGPVDSPTPPWFQGSTCTSHPAYQRVSPPPPYFQGSTPAYQFPHGYPPMHWPYYIPPQSTPPSSTNETQFLSSRHRDWRQRKAAMEDQERVARGEAPRKRYKSKEGGYRYICTLCQKQKCADTGHTQVKGKWYCPSLCITVEEWRESLKKD